MGGVAVAGTTERLLLPQPQQQATGQTDGIERELGQEDAGYGPQQEPIAIKASAAAGELLALEVAARLAGHRPMGIHAQGRQVSSQPVAGPSASQRGRQFVQL